MSPRTYFGTFQMTDHRSGRPGRRWRHGMLCRLFVHCCYYRYCWQYPVPGCWNTDTVRKTSRDAKMFLITLVLFPELSSPPPHFWEILTWNYNNYFYYKQECLPVGCVQSATVAVSNAMHTPCHAPPCHEPPVTHTLLPCTPPCHAHPPPLMPLPHPPPRMPPCGQNDNYCCGR